MSHRRVELASRAMRSLCLACSTAPSTASNTQEGSFGRITKRLVACRNTNASVRGYVASFASSSHAKPRRGASVHYVVTSFGPDRPGIVSEVTAQVFAASGNVEESRMARLHGDFTISMLVSFVDAGASAENVQSFTESLNALPGLTTSVRRPTDTPVTTRAKASSRDRYKRVLLRGSDFPGITNTFANVLANRGINIESMNTDTQPAPFGNEKLFIVDALVRLPDTCEQTSREAFAVSLKTLERDMGLDVEVSDHEQIT